MFIITLLLIIYSVVNPRSPEEKNSYTDTRGRGGGGGVNRTMQSATFDTIHLIGMTFGTYKKLHLYFQLSETTSYFIGFPSNNSQINDVTSGHLLGFLNLQILFKFEFLYFKMMRKQQLKSTKQLESVVK